MTTKDILNLDYRKKENKEIIQRVLKQIKPLSKYSDEYEIPFEAIEKAVVVMTKKYNMRVSELVPDVWSNEEHAIWRAIIVNEINHKIIDMVYGITLYEVLAKTAIRLYAEVKKGMSKRD